MPSVGTFADIDLERLAVLEPTAVLAMTDPGKLPAALTAAATNRGFTLRARAYPKTLDEALMTEASWASRWGGRTRRMRWSKD